MNRRERRQRRFHLAAFIMNNAEAWGYRIMEVKRCKYSTYIKVRADHTYMIRVSDHPSEAIRLMPQRRNKYFKSVLVWDRHEEINRRVKMTAIQLLPDRLN